MYPLHYIRSMLTSPEVGELVTTETRKNYLTDSSGKFHIL